MVLKGRIRTRLRRVKTEKLQRRKTLQRRTKRKLGTVLGTKKMPSDGLQPECSSFS